jgi:hypothetical protein
MGITKRTTTSKTGLKTTYLTLSGVSLVGLITYLIAFGFTITGTDDKCAGSLTDPCVSNLSFKNPTPYNVNVKSKEQLVFDFSPISCVKDYKLMMGGKEVNWSKGVTFTRMKTTKMQLILYKTDPTCTIKFGVNTSSYYLDPVFEGVGTSPLNLSKVCDYGFVFWNETIDKPYWVNESYQQQMDNWTYNCFTNKSSIGCNVSINATACRCGPIITCKNGESCNITYDPYWVTKWHMVEYHNYTVVTKNKTVETDCNQTVTVNGKTFYPASLPDTPFCAISTDKSKIICDSSWDANHDGICTAGESCLVFTANLTSSKVVVTTTDHIATKYDTELKKEGINKTSVSTVV